MSYQSSFAGLQSHVNQPAVHSSRNITKSLTGAWNGPINYMGIPLFRQQKGLESTKDLTG